MFEGNNVEARISNSDFEFLVPHYNLRRALDNLNLLLIENQAGNIEFLEDTLCCVDPILENQMFYGYEPQLSQEVIRVVNDYGYQSIPTEEIRTGIIEWSRGVEDAINQAHDNLNNRSSFLEFKFQCQTSPTLDFGLWNISDEFYRDFSFFKSAEGIEGQIIDKLVEIESVAEVIYFNAVVTSTQYREMRIRLEFSDNNFQ